MNEFVFQNPSGTILAVTVAVGTVIAAAGVWLYQKQQQQNSSNQRSQSSLLKRSWSFTSEGMRLGCFPESIHAPPTVINAVLYFDESPIPSIDDIVSKIVEPLLNNYERFRLVPKNPLSDCTASASSSSLRESKTNYMANDLIRTISISSNDPKILHDTIVEALQYELDTNNRNNNNNNKDLPWWEIVRIENNHNQTNNDPKSNDSNDNNGYSSACILRVHHCLGDGLSLVHIFDKILVSAAAAAAEESSSSSSSSSSPVESKVTRSLLNRGQNNNNNNNNNNNSFSSWLSNIASIASAAAHVLTLPASKYDDPTPFRPNIHTSKNDMDMIYSNQRNYLLFPTVPLDFVKDIKNKASAMTTTMTTTTTTSSSSSSSTSSNITVNDVLMFSISQAMHDYFKYIVQDPNFIDDSSSSSQNNDTTKNNTNINKQSKQQQQKRKKSIQCRALLPASLPRSKMELETTPMQNKWCMVSADMHIKDGNDDNDNDPSSSSSLKRLKAISSTTRLLKSTPRAHCQLWVQNNLAPFLPVSLARQTTLDLFSRHSLVLTNVPGPETKVLFANQPVSRVQMLFPNILPQISLLTYNGNIYGNIVYDPTTTTTTGSQFEDSMERTFGKFYAKAYVDLAKDVAIPSEQIPKDLIGAATDVMTMIQDKEEE